MKHGSSTVKSDYTRLLDNDPLFVDLSFFFETFGPDIDPIPFLLR